MPAGGFPTAAALMRNDRCKELDCKNCMIPRENSRARKRGCGNQPTCCMLPWAAYRIAACPWCEDSQTCAGLVDKSCPFFMELFFESKCEKADDAKALRKQMMPHVKKLVKEADARRPAGMEAINNGIIDEANFGAYVLPPASIEQAITDAGLVFSGRLADAIRNEVYAGLDKIIKKEMGR